MIDRESKWLGLFAFCSMQLLWSLVSLVAKHTWGVRFLLDFCCCYVHTIYSFMVMISTEKWALPLLVMLGIITAAIPKRQTVGVTLVQRNHWVGWCQEPKTIKRISSDLGHMFMNISEYRFVNWLSFSVIPAWSSGQDSWLSPSRPGFDFRYRKITFYIFERKLAC